MAVTSVIACPECEKKFKGRDDLQGKKIRCPNCGHAFIVQKVARDKVDSDDEAKTPPPKAPARKAAPADAKPGAEQLFDEDGNPYGVTTLDLSPRCPNCANELLGANVLVCHHCGYNTQSRTVGQTRKVIEQTGGERIMWLLPSLLCALGLLILYIGNMWYCFHLADVLPKDSWAHMFNHESMRLWIAMLSLGLIWGVGMWIHKRLLFEPRPPEKLKE